MKSQISGLNGLRAISIVLVINSHLSTNHFFSDNTVLKYLGYFFFNAGLGVNMFFVISGFLITTLLIKEKNKNNYISLRKFYYRRMIRIFPAYYFLLLVYMILQFCGFLKISVGDWISDLTYTKQFFTYSANETGHLWSLSVEEVFYLIWPIAFIKFEKHSEIILIVLSLLITGYRMYDYSSVTMICTIMFRGDALLIGCLFAIKYDVITAWVMKHINKAFLVFPLLLLCVLLNTYVYHLSSKNINVGGSGDVTKLLLRLTWGLGGNIGLITNLAIALIIVISINSKSIWATFLNLPFMDYIGKLSYSLYLWQTLFTVDRPYLHKLPIVVILLMIFTCAIFSYYIIERPFLRLKKAFEVN